MILKNREEVLNMIQADVYAEVQNRLYADLGIGYNRTITMSDLSYAIASAVAQGVKVGMETLLENQYTNEDFERDMTLNG